MTSRTNQWIVYTTLCALLDTSLGHNNIIMATHIGYVTLALVIADVLWGLWLRLQS
jgi:hypothetical protein